MKEIIRIVLVTALGLLALLCISLLTQAFDNIGQAVEEERAAKESTLDQIIDLKP